MPPDKKGTEKSINVVQGYAQTVLAPQLRFLGLSEQQRDIVVADVTTRLQSLLSHWHDVSFRRTILVLGAEEGSFWEPHEASMETRSLVVVAVRNSLLEDLHASHPYTEALRSRTRLLPVELVPAITSEAIKYFQGFNLDAEQMQAPTNDVFGGLPHRFPSAWRVLSLLGNSSNMEVTCGSPSIETKPIGFFTGLGIAERHSVSESGIDPGVGRKLAEVLQQIGQRQRRVLFSSSFRGLTRNPEKLFSIIDHVLRCGAMLLTPNYLLSPAYVARRNPLLRPAHTEAEITAQISNTVGLNKRHKDALASIMS